jgi:hypothetical protein
MFTKLHLQTTLEEVLLSVFAFASSPQLIQISLRGIFPGGKKVQQDVLLPLPLLPRTSLVWGLLVCPFRVCLDTFSCVTSYYCDCDPLSVVLGWGHSITFSSRLRLLWAYISRVQTWEASRGRCFLPLPPSFFLSHLMSYLFYLKPPSLIKLVTKGD